jgi:transposase
MTKESTGKNKALSGEQKFKLFMWIEKNRADVGRLTAEDAAVKATAELGFEVGHHSMGNARRSAGIHLNHRSSTGNQKDRVRALAKIVQDLHIAVGVKIPETLVSLLGHALNQ